MVGALVNKPELLGASLININSRINNPRFRPNDLFTEYLLSNRDYALILLNEFMDPSVATRSSFLRTRSYTQQVLSRYNLEQMSPILESNFAIEQIASERGIRLKPIPPEFSD